MASIQCISHRQALAKTLHFNCPLSDAMKCYVGNIKSVAFCHYLSLRLRFNLNSSKQNRNKDTWYALNPVQGMSSTVNQRDSTIHLSTPYHLPPSPSFQGCTPFHTNGAKTANGSSILKNSTGVESASAGKF